MLIESWTFCRQAGRITVEESQLHMRSSYLISHSRSTIDASHEQHMMRHGGMVIIVTIHRLVLMLSFLS
jgi:hypothetical protein